MKWYWKLKLFLLIKKYKPELVFWLDRVYPITQRNARMMQRPAKFILYMQNPENTSIYRFDSINTFKDVYMGIKSIVLNLKTPGELYKSTMEVRKEPDNFILLSAIKEVENSIKNIVNKK